MSRVVPRDYVKHRPGIGDSDTAHFGPRRLGARYREVSELCAKIQPLGPRRLLALALKPYWFVRALTGDAPAMASSRHVSESAEVVVLMGASTPWRER